MAKKKYRQGVAAIVLNNNDEVLIGQRRTDPTHYQFPQGGIKKGESAEDALRRELREEIGTEQVDILHKLTDKTGYVWPKYLRKKSKFDGQQHQWFVVRLQETAKLSPSKEFSAFRWVAFDEILNHTSPVRHEVYREVMIQLSRAPLHLFASSRDTTPGEAFSELVAIMQRLRNPDGGCPWDLEQTHASIRPYLIEETYEVAEAIDKNDMTALKEELGDLLLQIVFHSQMEAEVDTFTIVDVIEHINEKMIRRHPHIFGTIEANDAATVLRNWEEIKKSEGKKRDSILEGIPVGLPALLKARRVQERVSSVGFDWKDVDPAMDKVREEVEEFAHVCQQGDADAIEDELGDLFFALVNVARFVEVDPEKALERTVRKFMKRFRHIERTLTAQGIELSDATLEEMDVIWEKAKAFDTEEDEA